MDDAADMGEAVKYDASYWVLFQACVFPDPELHLQRITEGSEKLFLFPAPLDFDSDPVIIFGNKFAAL